MRITTDANGNYDRTGLPSGSYLVELVLAAGQGTPAQDPITILLASDTTVVQHLSFRSQPADPTPSATAPLTPEVLPQTGGPASDALVWALLAIGMIALGGGISIARYRSV